MTLVLRTAATREIIAGRDFYDLDYLLREGFDFNDREVLKLFKKKLEEDNFSSGVSRRDLACRKPSMS